MITAISGDIPNYVQSLFELCEKEKASDLHLEPTEKNYRIRLRVDGNLKIFSEFPASFAEGMLHHFKVLSHTNVAENRRPQDGRIVGKNIRVSFCPTFLGEKCVLRFLQTGIKKLDIYQLGFLPEQQEAVLQALHRPQGLILVTGPTGSGKSLTLYSILSYLNSPQKNIMTIEDPIEMPISGLTQIQVNPDIGLDFSDILRSVLRQDPNILMIGEIRDEKTAKMAIKASQTGHLVFATLHANSALESLPRLENLGIDRFNLTCSISLLLAQRLVRKIGGGRTALFEVIPMDSTLKERYLSHSPLPPPSISLKDHGLKLVQAGVLTFDEVQHVCG